MKRLTGNRNWWLLLLVPFLIQGVCSKDDENSDDSVTSADQYVTWQIPGHNGNLKTPLDSFTLSRSAPYTHVYALDKTASKQFEISFEGAEAPGNYQSTNFQIVVDGRYYVQAASPVQISVSTFGAAGQYMIGTYSGTVQESNNPTPIAVSGKFRIRH